MNKMSIHQLVESWVQLGPDLLLERKLGSNDSATAEVNIHRTDTSTTLPLAQQFLAIHNIYQQLLANTPAPRQRKLGFPVTTGQQFIELQQIVYAEAQDNVATLYLTNKKTVKITKSLGWLETQLQDHGFCRIHHSYVINFNHLEEYIRNEGGYLIMSTGKALSLTRRRKERFLTQLQEWKFIA